MVSMTLSLRKLEPGEESVGIHDIQAVAEDGTVLARYECPCDWCQVWRAARPMMERALRELEPERRPDWLG